MPIRAVAAPALPALRDCLRAWRRRASRATARRAIPALWKGFRAAPCGKAWYEALLSCYGKRCVYCDHSPARTLDHRRPKARRITAVFDWANWAGCCGDCNRRKGSTGGLIDPYVDDPRHFFAFDVVTGSPDVLPTLAPRHRQRAEKTLRILDLDHQVLTDARRAKCRVFLIALTALAADPSEVNRAAVQKHLTTAEPHRAILRDLILQDDALLNPHLAVVTTARGHMPELVAWAEQPPTLAGP